MHSRWEYSSEHLGAFHKGYDLPTKLDSRLPSGEYTVYRKISILMEMCFQHIHDTVLQLFEG